MKTNKYIKKLSEIVLMFIIFFLPLIFCGMAVDPFWVTEKFFFKFTLSILVIFYGIYFLTIKKLPAVKTPLNLIFILFILINIAGIIKIFNIYYYLDKFVINIYYILFFLATIFVISQQENNKNKILLLMISSVVFMVIYGIIQTVGFDIISWQSNFGGRAASTLGNPNFLAGHILLFLPLVYSFLFEQKNKKNIFITLIIALLLTYGLLITQTRGAYFAFFISMLFMLILIFVFETGIFIKNKKILSTVFIFVIILSTSFFILNKNALNRVKNIILLEDEAARIRLSLWKNSLHLIKDNFLLGTGAGNFPIRYSYYQASSLSPDYFKKSDFYRSSHSHNDYIQFVAEYGIIGAGIIFFLIFLFFKISFKYFNSNEDKKIFIIGLLSGILGMLIHAFFNFPLLIIPTATYFYCFGAILVFSCKEASVELKPLDGKITYPLILFLFLFLLIIVFSFHSFLANIYLRKAKESEYFNKTGDAFYYAENAIKIDPYNEENYKTLALLYEKTGNNKEICNCYKKIYELNRSQWEANLNLFDCYALEGQKDKMLEIGQNLYKISPYSKKAIRSFGLGLYINGQYDNAITIFTKGINLYNDDYEMFTFLAISYAAKGELEKAITNFNNAIAIKPDFKDAYFNMAIAYYSFKKYNEAKNVINNMKKLGFYDEKTKNLMQVIQDEK